MDELSSVTRRREYEVKKPAQPHLPSLDNLSQTLPCSRRPTSVPHSSNASEGWRAGNPRPVLVPLVLLDRQLPVFHNASYCGPGTESMRVRVFCAARQRRQKHCPSTQVIRAGWLVNCGAFSDWLLPWLPVFCSIIIWRNRHSPLACRRNDVVSWHCDNQL